MKSPIFLAALLLLCVGSDPLLLCAETAPVQSPSTNAGALNSSPAFQLGALDWATLIGYLCIVIGIGFIASYKIKGTDSYFLGGRKFGKLVMIGQSFGTGTNAGMPVSLAGKVYGEGLGGIWYQWKSMFVTPFYWLLAPLFRRFRRTTMAEVVEDRFGPWMGACYTVFAIIFFTINLGSMLKGAGKVISEATGADFSIQSAYISINTVDVLILVMSAIFIVYSFFGGLLASAWNDFLQGFLIIFLSFMLLPLGWSQVGGLQGMKDSLGSDYFSLVTTKFGIGFIIVLTLNGLIGIVAQPQLIASVGTGKDEMTCRVGQLYGTVVKRICTIGWAVVGLMVAAMIVKGANNGQALKDHEEAFGFACRNLLFPGGIGLLVASILASNMAGCSAFMVTSGALLTNGFYRKYVYRTASDKHYLLIGRLSGLLVALAAVLYAVFLIKGVLYSFLLTETLATYFGVSIFSGIIWRRTNRWGAIASIVVAMAANFLGYYFLGERLDSWRPDVFLFALCIGVAALIIVSLLTPPEPIAKMEKFYGNLETPNESTGNESELEPNARDLKAIAKTGKQLLIVNLFRLRTGAAGEGFFRAYRVDLIGFAVGFAIVFGIIGIVWFLIVR
jgi:Na+/proline symporter